ncbi:hypothetical protein [Halobacterium wangiae]|uniref:hypothetical protein n=1 Tax=Halobacterium wangiae TaxID=2902623 RepID=UPI001E3B0DB2|nr:hypothetical protein [Halobacterium wangiae]
MSRAERFVEGAVAIIVLSVFVAVSLALMSIFFPETALAVTLGLVALGLFALVVLVFLLYRLLFGDGCRGGAFPGR